LFNHPKGLAYKGKLGTSWMCRLSFSHVVVVVYILLPKVVRKKKQKLLKKKNMSIVPVCFSNLLHHKNYLDWAGGAAQAQSPESNP
jgi:hypothetical protein